MVSRSGHTKTKCVAWALGPGEVQTLGYSWVGRGACEDGESHLLPGKR